VFEGPQASSDEDANIVMIKVSSGAFNHVPCLLILIFVLCSILVVYYKFIGVVWHRSCIKIDLSVDPCNPISLWLTISNVLLRG
jgi:hypothetical protein